MSNYVVPGPNGGIPSIKYIEHLRDAGILSQQIAATQINYINTFNQIRGNNIKKRADIIKQIIEREANIKANKVNNKNE